MIEFSALTKWYGTVRGAADISFSVQPGEVFGYLGPNGSGKSTTLRCAMGLLRPTSGEIRVFGEPVRAGCATGHEQIGFLPGELRLWPRVTGRKALEVLGALGGCQQTASRRRQELAERLHLDLDRPIGKLSKGNRQKVGLVLTFQSDPDLLILDEPTTGLDPLIVAVALDLIREAAARGAAVLLSSHDLGQVAAVGHRTAILREGRLVVMDRIDTLVARSEHHLRVWFAKPATPFPVHAFTGVRILKTEDRYLHLAYRGSPDTLLRWLGKFEVKRLISPEPTLEEAFLEYYQSPAADKEES